MGLTAAGIAAELERLRREAEAAEEPLLAYLIGNAALEARKAAERRSAEASRARARDEENS